MGLRQMGWDVFTLAQGAVNTAVQVSDLARCPQSPVWVVTVERLLLQQQHLCEVLSRARCSLALVCSLQSSPTLLQDCALKAPPETEEAAGWGPAAPAKSERLHCKDGEAGRENERGGGKGKSIKSLGMFSQA